MLTKIPNIKRYNFGEFGDIWITFRYMYYYTINFNPPSSSGSVFCFVGEKGREACTVDIAFFFAEPGDFVLE